MKFEISKMYTIILILLLIATFSSCKSQLANQNSSNSSKTLPSPEISSQSASDKNDINDKPELSSQPASDKNDILDKFADRSPTAKDITDSGSWIKATNPTSNEISVDDSSNISIIFKYDMDDSTLNKNNIIIFEGKHSSIISDLFDYEYDKNTKVLNIKFKEAGNLYGSEEGVTILICGEIKNLNKKSMQTNIKFGFSTK